MFGAVFGISSIIGVLLLIYEIVALSFADLGVWDSGPLIGGALTDRYDT